MTDLAVRQDRGIYYTPAAVARHIARTACALLDRDRFGEELQVLDPACGNGRLLSALLRTLVTSLPASPAQALGALHGLDADAQALQQARRRLLRLAARTASAPLGPSIETQLARQFICADTLRIGIPAAHGSGSSAAAWDELFPAAFRRANPGFDLILSNPPFVNIRRVTRLYGAAAKEFYAQHYVCARGAYDQYVLFLERATQVLRAGGVLAIIVPNKWQVAEYAAVSRRLLADAGQLLRVDDLSEMHVFSKARVYPLVLYWARQPPSRRPSVPLVRLRTWSELAGSACCTAESQGDSFLSFSGEGVARRDTWPLRVDTVPLGQIARVSSGATGFEARQLADALDEVHTPDSTHFRFVVTGNIDRYVLRWGATRFMGRCLSTPALHRQHAMLSRAKQQLYSAPKIIVAGLTRRIEAAWDSAGYALGVQTFAITHDAGNSFYLLGLLNSKLFTWYYRRRYHGKQLGGRFIAIHKRPLTELPIVPWACESRSPVAELQHRVVSLATQLARAYASPLLPDNATNSSAARTSADHGAAPIEAALDAAVYALYELTPEEIEQVEHSIGELSARSSRSKANVS